MIAMPVKELKDGAKISAKCHELDEPITITKNGYNDMVIMSSKVFARYDQLMQRMLERELNRQRELDDIAEDFRVSMAEYRAGKGRDGFEVLAELREKHGL